MKIAMYENSVILLHNVCNNVHRGTCLASSVKPILHSAKNGKKAINKFIRLESNNPVSPTNVKQNF